MKKKFLKKLSNLDALKTNINSMRQNSSFKAIFFIIIVIFFTYLFISQSLTVVQLRYQMADMQDELTEKENDNKLLIEQIEKKTTDQYIEETARDRLGMVKSNEVPVKVVEREEEDTTEAVLEPKQKIGIYMRDWYFELKTYIELMKQK